MLGDLDADGRNDVVLGESFSVGVMLGRPGGRLMAAPAWQVLDFGHASLIADLDGDGRPDVVSVSSSSSAGAPSQVEVALQKTAGVWTPRPPVSVPGDCAGGQLVDFDHDGNLDLVLAQQTSGNLAWLKGGGDGSLAAAQAIGGGSGTFAAADLDGDHLPEIVQVGAKLMLRTGSTGAWSTLIDSATFGSVRIADVDGDGKLDLITTEGAAGATVLAFRRGKGGVAFEDPKTTTASLGAWALGDLDGDGDLDVVGDRSGGVSSFIFDAGKFGNAVDFAAQELNYARDVAVADFDGDGKGDLLYSGGYGFFAYVGDGKGGWGGRFAFPPGYADALGVGDVDGDGKKDIAAFADRAAWVGINTSRR
jgi:hypothetical protein